MGSTWSSTSQVGAHYRMFGTRAVAPRPQWGPKPWGQTPKEERARQEQLAEEEVEPAGHPPPTAGMRRYRDSDLAPCCAPHLGQSRTRHPPPLSTEGHGAGAQQVFGFVFFNLNRESCCWM